MRRTALVFQGLPSSCLSKAACIATHGKDSEEGRGIEYEAEL